LSGTTWLINPLGNIGLPNSTGQRKDITKTDLRDVGGSGSGSCTHVEPWIILPDNMFEDPASIKHFW